ncbi:hypothetical protein RCJ22_39055 [Vibrio sp. FNV 38]|nr:hypothetical protein [Vibrio sp. FNV 38]
MFDDIDLPYFVHNICLDKNELVKSTTNEFYYHFDELLLTLTHNNEQHDVVLRVIHSAIGTYELMGFKGLAKLLRNIEELYKQYGYVSKKDLLMLEVTREAIISQIKI